MLIDLQGEINGHTRVAMEVQEAMDLFLQERDLFWKQMRQRLEELHSSAVTAVQEQLVTAHTDSLRQVSRKCEPH